MMTLYPYQLRIREALTRKKRVIVQIPTGGGKTLGALYPYFETLDRFAGNTIQTDLPLPWTCRYAVPMRVLASQFEREYQDYFARLDQRRGTDFVRRYQATLGLKLPAIQTGETPDDPQFESPLTFCTIDQLLASFIGTPYSIGHARANINVGAVVGSYLILDEFHLFPLEGGSQGARATTLAMLQMLRDFSPFVLMTATFSTHLLQELATLLDAEIVQVDDDVELAEIMQGRARTIHLADAFMTPSAILDAHTAVRAGKAAASLVVCNTVARAQATYVQVRDELAQRGILDRFNVQLLHSRFTQGDRKAKSAQLEAWLGKDRWQNGQFAPSDGKDVIVIGTQVVEVGLNISCDVLHSELAPANSLIQRSGRCARFAGQQGTVIVYPIPPRETKQDDQTESKISYKPYDDALCQATWAHLGEMIAVSVGPFAFDFRAEQALIDAVHTEEDRAMLATFRQNDMQIKQSIMEVLTSHERGKEGELIRNVEQVSIIIHPTPETDIITEPFAWESFGLHPGTLAGAWKALDDRRAELDYHTGRAWTMKELKAVGKDQGDDALGADGDNDRPTVYTWDPIVLANPKDAFKRLETALRVALPPELATYDAELGFRLLLEGPFPIDEKDAWKSSYVPSKKGNREDFGGKQGSYVEHISGLMRAYRFSVQHEFAWVAARLEHALNLPVGSIDHAVRLAIACHDIGKLSRDWQGWAHAWQRLLVAEKGQGYAVTPQRAFLAKTDRLNWYEEKALRKKMKTSRPHHACESALASTLFIGKRLAANLEKAQQPGGLALTQATISAIARHHTALAVNHEAAAWAATACTALAEALAACQLPTDTTDLPLTAIDKGEIPAHWLVKASHISPEAIAATWLGFALVRTLRLCDQRAEREL